ncbi:hypothetical protein PHET_01800 [Paragonimus heterotremus]|uniref:DUF4201 domain-containing protein n=1 Tax=Paragonimus heterotremus TaxID=100268 RepID=A0A8J4TLT3_9TREM|nr:hypothetical protein PHET_01800 [Paragonimus heterotremus]
MNDSLYISNEEKSVLSHNSESSSRTTNWDDLTVIMRNKQRLTEQLNTENEFLKNFIDRNRINLEATETPVEVVSKRHTVRMKSKPSFVERYRLLEAEQKCYVLYIEKELFKQKIKEYYNKCERTLETLQAKTEANAMKNDEIQRFYDECKSTVTTEMVHGKRIYVAETFLRYHEKHELQRNNLIYTTRLQNDLLRVNVRRLRRQIRSAEEDDKPTLIDFEAVQHANHMQSEQLQERTKTLVRTKQKFSQLSLELCYRKDKLNKLALENEQLAKAYHDKYDRTSSLALGLRNSLQVILDEGMLNETLQNRIRYNHAPEVNAFVRTLINKDLIEREQKICERRRHIARIMYKQQRSILSKLIELGKRQAHCGCSNNYTEDSQN